MSEAGEEGILRETIDSEKEPSLKEQRLSGYESWHQALQRQVQEGKLKTEQADTIIARKLLARDLWIDRYRDQSLRDGLTGLANQKAFQQKQSSLVRSNIPFGLLVIDLDHFKVVNDTHGHLSGNKALVQVGLMIESQLREVRKRPSDSGDEIDIENYDVVARIGGEEFGVLLPGIQSEEDLLKVAERIRETFESNPLSVAIGSETKDIPMTVSIGGGLHQQGEDSESFFHRVDKEGLYQAKQQGRNRTIILPTK